MMIPPSGKMPKNGYRGYCDRLNKAGRTLSHNDRYVIFSSQILVYASLATLNAMKTQQLLEKAYTLDYLQDEDNTQQDSLTASQEFWRTQLLTEQTSFAFIDGEVGR